METFTADGTIQAVGPGKIQMLTNTNQSWVVMIPAKSNVHVRGTAAAAYLRPGQFVRFKAKLDAQGHAQGTLDELTIFVPEKPDQIGVQQEEGVAAPVAPAFGVGARPPVAEAGPQVMAFSVAGRITGLRDEKMSVHVGRGVVIAAINDQTRMLVDVADYSLAQPGDKISVSDAQIGRPGLAQAGRVTIELGHMLGVPVESPPKSVKPPVAPLPPSGRPQGDLPQ